MRCLAMGCSCCWVMAGNWSVEKVVPPWRLWCRRGQISCWCLSLNHWSSLVGFRCNRSFSTSQHQTTCWRCRCCLDAAGISSVFGCWWLCCCCCHSGCSWWGSCCRQDLETKDKNLFTFSSFALSDKEQEWSISRLRRIQMHWTLNEFYELLVNSKLNWVAQLGWHFVTWQSQQQISMQENCARKLQCC